ncbi:probable cytochrome P450 12a5, mitochondrial [Mytilus trossulus]|uniref:probable cytochrome P450 12a5, mitochondrial n=1 Tax=Mytilus trossulus TaxID=6551 RepID=UPI003004C27B
MMNVRRILHPSSKYITVFKVQSYSCRTSTTIADARNEPPLSSDVKPYNQVPGPRGLYNIPYFGAALHFKPFGKYQPGDINIVLDNLKQKYGDIYKIQFGPNKMVVLSHPDYAKAVLQAHYEQHEKIGFDISNIFHKRTKTTKGMVMLNGQEWAERRKPAQEKMLRPAVVASYVPLIESVTDDFIDVLQKKTKVDDLLLELLNYTTESVGMLALNKRLGCLDSEKDKSAVLASVIRNVLDMFQESFFMPFKSYCYFRTPFYKRFEENMLKFGEIVNAELALQHDFLTKLQHEGRLEEYLEKEPNFMYSLLSDSRVTDDQVNSIVMDLFGAGIDSSANTLVFLLYQLAVNKDKQNNLIEEIKKVVGNSQKLTKEHLASMSYMKACLKESHRVIFPTSAGLARVIETDLVIRGYRVPKDTLLIINMSSMSADDRFFSQPTKFLPERWLRNTTDELAKSKEFPFAHKPFGFGPRSCIGQRFAETEIFICLTKIIQHFEVSVPTNKPEMKTTVQLFTTPVDKVKMTFTPREKM